jgi:excisionase family DNA binding protein
MAISDEVNTEPLAVSVEEAARRLGISRNSGYAAARRGEIPNIRIGGRRLVPIAALNALLNQVGGVPAKGSSTDAKDRSAPQQVDRSHGTRRN